MNRLLRAAFAAAVLQVAGQGVLSAAPASAQSLPPGPPPRCEDGPAMLAGHLAFIETKLEIQGEQARAWAAFAQEIRTAAAPLDAVCRGGPRPGEIAQGSDPMQVLDRKLSPLMAAASAAGGMREAVRRLSDQLTAGQRQVLAQELGRPGPGLAFLPPPPPPPGFGPRGSGPDMRGPGPGPR